MFLWNGRVDRDRGEPRWPLRQCRALNCSQEGAGRTADQGGVPRMNPMERRNHRLISEDDARLSSCSIQPDQAGQGFLLRPKWVTTPATEMHIRLDEDGSGPARAVRTKSAPQEAPVSESSLDSGVTLDATRPAHDDRIVTRNTDAGKPRPTKNPRLARPRAPPERGFVSIARKTVTASPTDQRGRGFTGVIRHRPRRVSPSPMIKPEPASIRGELGTNWQQYWQRQPNAATMRKDQGGDVLALDSQTLSITATCFQYHDFGRRPGLKIRSS